MGVKWSLAGFLCAVKCEKGCHNGDVGAAAGLAYMRGCSSCATLGCRFEDVVEGIVLAVPHPPEMILHTKSGVPIPFSDYVELVRTEAGAVCGERDTCTAV